MLFYFQFLMFKYIFLISKCTISSVAYTVVAPQASVSAEVQSARCWAVDAKLFIAKWNQDTVNGQSKLLERKEEHEWKK